METVHLAPNAQVSIYFLDATLASVALPIGAPGPQRGRMAARRMRDD
jgi:hypothetical protein